MNKDGLLGLSQAPDIENASTQATATKLRLPKLWLQVCLPVKGTESTLELQHLFQVFEFELGVEVDC